MTHFKLLKRLYVKLLEKMKKRERVAKDDVHLLKKLIKKQVSITTKESEIEKLYDMKHKFQHRFKKRGYSSRKRHHHRGRRNKHYSSSFSFGGRGLVHNKPSTASFGSCNRFRFGGGQGLVHHNKPSTASFGSCNRFRFGGGQGLVHHNKPSTVSFGSNRNFIRNNNYVSYGGQNNTRRASFGSCPFRRKASYSYGYN